MTDEEFSTVFESLVGVGPLSWQVRLYRDHFAKNDLPHVIGLPTGLGKTMVIAIWLIARAFNNELPRRLIYVVDRRTVVDQATDIAQMLVQRPITKWMHDAFNGQSPAISTLRGQLADNREWSRDPSRPAIIIGTVDLIGSGLLFSGYRSSYKRRPLEAGLLGQDSLLVLDEAHLSRPFEKLIAAIGDDGPYQKDRDGNKQGKPMRVIRMSATSASPHDEKPPFTLGLDPHGNLTGEDEKDATVAERFVARKRLTVMTLGAKDKLVDKLAAAAIDLVAPSKPDQKPVIGQRIVVFTRRPEDARFIAEIIRKHGAKKNAPGPYAEAVEVLTGTMRGLERDELVKKSVFTDRWLNGDLKTNDPVNQTPVFLISTSAGEVGFDLNADHLVGDAAPLDSWIQRLGRVNRRGMGDATVVLINESEPAGKTDFDKASIATSKLLRDGTDVSPKALAAFKKTLTPEQIREAASPTPAMAELTDILLDAWSMTSIRERIPGRPEVGPWLRGIDDNQSQTAVAWRAEVGLFADDTSPEKALQSIFTKHPVRPHESLTVNTAHLLDFFKRIPKLKDRPHDLMTTRAFIRLPRGRIVCRTIQQLVDEPGLLYADSTLILPADFGGLDNARMLDAESIPKATKKGDPEPPSLDVADHEGYEQTDVVRPRLRILIKRSDDGSWSPKPLPGLSIPHDIKLKSDYGKSPALFDDLRGADLRVRLVQPIRFDDEDVAIESLVILAPAPSKKEKEDQLLTVHVGAVEKCAVDIACALALPQDDPIHIALRFAAKWHDEGKKARIWQLFANNPDPEDEANARGKMARSRDPKLLRGYRHEFGSLMRIRHPDRCNTTGCDHPADFDARELALHLIATHHGAGRPHFEHAVYDPFTDGERDEIQADCLRRFARLQRKYGWWQLAWLENLLRCADQLASANDEVTEIDEIEEVES